MMRWWLWQCTLWLIILHLIVLFTGRWGLGLPEAIGRLFFLDQEYNVPAFYVSFLFILCAYYCAHVGFATHIRQKSYAVVWIFLSALLLFLSADEWFGLHERLIIPLRAYFGIEQGPFYFAWTIAYIALIVLVLLITVPWLRALEPALRRKLLLGAGVYVNGALVLEMIGGWVYSTNGHEYTPLYANIVTLEESLELIGLTLTTLALSHYFRSFNLRRGRDSNPRYP